MANIHGSLDLIIMDELLASLKSFKNKDTPETDGLNKELIKCASQQLTVAFPRSE
jgi:hypothetical protein